MRTTFDGQLEFLSEELTMMGTLCERAIAMATKALVSGDMTTAERVPEVSVQIDNKEREIENLCMKLLLKQQPVATDLRVISSALKMITDMARIGDQSADIAEIITMANIDASDDTLFIQDMAVAVIKMVNDSIDAFAAKDTELAAAVVKYDDVVDNCFDKIKKTLIERFSKPETDGEYALDLLMIAKYFERIGDHAVNIAGWVIYSITGSHETENE